MTMKTCKIILVILIALAATPNAMARIYLCDGPDRQCGPDAKNVELADTSGLTGVSEDVKAELASKKAEREKAREADRQRNNNRTVINNQYTTVNTEPYGRWLYPAPWRPKPEKPRPPVVKPTPLPSTIRLPRK
jgi:hypothetical protein